MTAATAATTPAAGPPIDAQIPQAEISQLQALAAQGLLSGVDPAILAAQIQAESSGSGGAVNSAGYGGYLGLAANTPYGPQGLTVTPAQLTSTSPTAFDTQAEAAAALDSSLLQQYGGNTVAMEQAYQLGPNSPVVGTQTATEGTAVFAADQVPTIDPPGTGAQLTGFAGGAWDPLNWPGYVGGALGGAVGSAAGSAASAAGSAVASAIGPVLLKIVFVVGALGVIALGLARMFPGVTQTVTTAVQRTATAGA